MCSTRYKWKVTENILALKDIVFYLKTPSIQLNFCKLFEKKL